MHLRTLLNMFLVFLNKFDSVTKKNVPKNQFHTSTEILLFGNELFWLAWEHNPICSREPEPNSPLTYPVLLIISGLHLCLKVPDGYRAHIH